MRIAHSRVVSDAAGYASLLSSRLLDLQRKLATGKEVETPSDDPAAFARIRSLKAEVADVDQFGRNQAAGRRVMDQAEATVENLFARVERLRVLAVQAANDTYTTGDLQAIAPEVSEILEDLVALANTRTEDRALFAGSDVRGTPFQAVRDELGAVRSVRYRGDLVELETEIERGALLPTTFPGARAFGAGGQVLRSTVTTFDGSTLSAHADREIAASMLPSSGVVDGSFVINGERIHYDLDGDPTGAEGDSLLDLAGAINDAPAGVFATVTGAMRSTATVADPTALLTTTFGGLTAGTVSLNGTAVSVTANETLATLRDKINVETSRTGVTAEILDAAGNVVAATFAPAAGPFRLRLSGGVEIDDAAAGSSNVFRDGGVGLGFTNGAAAGANLVGTVTEPYRLRLENAAHGAIALRDDNGSLLGDLGFIDASGAELDNFEAAAVVDEGTLFSTAIDFRDALETGDAQTVRTTILDRLDLALDALEMTRVEVGVRENRIDRAAERGAKFRENAIDLASRLEEADLAEVVTDLRQAQTAQEAALKAIAQTLGLSLLNFL